MQSTDVDPGSHPTGATGDAEADAILGAVAATVDGIAATFGPSCEVLVHDYRRPESSVVAVAGTVTGRRAGDPMSEIGQRMYAAGDDAQPDLNYQTRTPDGRLMKSSTIPLRTSNGQVIGALCINVDTTVLHTMREQLTSLLGAMPAESAAVTEFPTSFNAALEELLLFESRHRGKDLAGLTRSERRDLLRRIDERGLLQARGAVKRISTKLGVSRAAIYRDLKEHDGAV